MNVKSLLLTERQELNSLLCAPLNVTKRIQYTCIAVSENFIILGAISGSLYLFAREPCSFKQLIPLSEGAISKVQISPDQKTVALATVKGKICIISITPVKLITVHIEHIGKKVTCLCWNQNNSKIYAGDEAGKISVSVLPTFKVNGMFQSHSCSLMNLGSKIVQIDFNNTIILISTLKCCYVCDTVSEKYKQIGNKPRHGEFGACFYQALDIKNIVSKNMNRSIKVAEKIQFFSLSREKKSKINDSKNISKIFCARPGSRLWEVTITGDVIKTHQFKEALAIAPLPVYKPYKGKHLKLMKSKEMWPIQSINFPQLFVVNEKYLLSYTLNCLYIFDPENNEVVLWNDEFQGILMVSVINDKIYLMMSSGVFHCLTLESTSSLILNLYNTKLYKECFIMCHSLRPEIIKFVSENFNDIDSKTYTDISDKLDLIISLIKSNYKTQLEKDVAFINSENKSFKNDFTSNKRGFKIGQTLDDNLLPIYTNNDLVYSLPEDATKKFLLDENSLQKTINQVHKDLESLSLLSMKMKPDVTEKQLQEIIKLFIQKVDDIKIKYELTSKFSNSFFEIISSAEIHYSNSLLKNLSLELLNKTENQEILTLVIKIFSDLNSSKYFECHCSFPYPVFGTDTSKLLKPKFFELGKILLKKFLVAESSNMVLQICKKIPFMWREYFSQKGYIKPRISDFFLILCLQTRDNVILSSVFPKINKQQWKVVDHCFKNIKRGYCVNCSNPYNNKQISMKFILDWPGVIYLIIIKEGPQKTRTVLNKIHENLSGVKFDKSVYQLIIFSSILRRHSVNHVIKFGQDNMEHNSIYSPRILQKVVQNFDHDLEQSINKEIFGFGPYHWGMHYNLSSSTCPCCTLSLQTPILLNNSGISLFPCGHAYHVDCMIQNKISKCNL